MIWLETRGREVAEDKRLSIKEFPRRERPRERLLNDGAESLSDAEILALLLGTGNAHSGETVLDLARRVLKRLACMSDGDAILRALADTTAEELREIPGVGTAKSAAVVAAVELGRRVASERPRLTSVKGPEDAARLLVEQMRYLAREHLKAVLLNTKNQVLGVEVVSIGSINSSVVHPREVFRVCIKRSAAAVILAHNHPSGDPTPSPEDIEVTRRVLRAGRLLGIDVLDHLIIGDDCYISLRQQGVDWDVKWQ